MSITLNPITTTVAAGSFNVSSEGYIQGTAQDAPNARFNLAGGYVATSETLPMWGGIGISENVTANEAGSPLIRATSLTQTAAGGLTGFTVFDQGHAMLTTPQSPVPLSGALMSVNFYRLGSGARISVACDPTLVNLQGQIISKQVSWDFVAQRLVPYLGTLTISSGTYNTTTGVIVLTMSAPAGFAAGDDVVLSSLTGTGAYATLNGTWLATAVSGSTVTLAGPVGAGAATITGGSLTLGSGASSAVAVKVLDVNIGNSMIVSYDPVTGFATWNRSGSTAVILI